jgi:hypothetical protein
MAIPLRWLAPAVFSLILAPSLGLAQPPTLANHRAIDPAPNVQDKADIWTMNLELKDPRMMVVDVPGRGKKVVWYLWYRVINRTDKEQTIIPKFELAVVPPKFALDDEVLPSVQEAIRKVEDPTDRYKVKNSVTISKTPIPPSKPDAAPRAVTGVAIWADVWDKARDVTRFNIVVSGISNGWSIDDDGKIYRKSLVLTYNRRGDGSRIDSAEIEYVGYEWFYRAQTGAVDLKPPESVKPMTEKK